MKHLLSSIALLTLPFSSIYCTDQIPDKLIIGDEIIYIESFPLDDLHFEISPFYYYNGKFSSPGTSCWRGYVATWEIIHNKLMLTEVKKVDSTSEKLDILDYFTRNNYKPEIIDGYVFASWCSAKFLIYPLKGLDKYSEFYLYDSFMPTDEVPQLIFDHGMLIKNNIRTMDSYHIGDTIMKEVTFYRHWLLKDGEVNVKAEIKDKNQTMVKIDIISYGTEKKRYIKKIMPQILGYTKESYWLNPRYWK